VISQGTNFPRPKAFSSPRLPLAFLAVVTSLVGCLGRSAVGRGYPLYPQTAERPPVSQVARLRTSLPLGLYPADDAVTIIDSVDDRSVSKVDSYFELAPGCHIVRTQSRVVTNSRRSGYTHSIGPYLFALRMRMGFEYAIVLEYSRYSSGARFLEYAVEWDSRGVQTQRIQPISTSDEAAACRAWSASASWEAPDRG
jgi:hypothetical protein